MSKLANPNALKGTWLKNFSVVISSKLQITQLEASPFIFAYYFNIAAVFMCIPTDSSDQCFFQF